MKAVFTDVGKALVAFVAQLLAVLAVGKIFAVRPEYLFIAGAVSFVAYLLSALLIYEFLSENTAANEIVGLYHGAYSLLAYHVFFAVTVTTDLSLGVVVAAPFAYFFPASHTRCELDTDGVEEHVITGLTLLVTFLLTVALFPLV